MEKEKKLEYIEYLLTDALEGGSNYWYYLRNEDLPSKKPGVLMVDAILLSLTKENGSLDVYDAEDEDELLGKLTLESMLGAFDLMEQNWPSHYDDLLNDNADASTADVWFQLAVMKDIVFG